MRFGTARHAAPKIYIQAALHADEVPAILVAHQLARLPCRSLKQMARLKGEVVLVPFANPIGLAQQVMGQHHGRFDLRDGVKFQPWVCRSAGPCGQRTGRPPLRRTKPDAICCLINVRRWIRNALANVSSSSASGHSHAGSEKPAPAPGRRCRRGARPALRHRCGDASSMRSRRRREMAEALGAQPSVRGRGAAGHRIGRPAFRRSLYAHLGCQLQQMLSPSFPIALACFASTVELRGENDTQHDLARQDAAGLCAYPDAHDGAITGPEVVITAAPLCKLRRRSRDRSPSRRRRPA